MDNAYSLLDGGRGPGLLGAGMPNYWVNTATLDLFLQDTIVSYQGLGPPVEITLSYVTGMKLRGMFGNNWRLPYEAQIIQQGNKIHLWKGSGQRLSYQSGTSTVSASNPTEVTPQHVNFDRLLDYGKYWLFWEKKSHLRYRFDKVAGTGQSRLTTISDANGNNLQIAFNQEGNIRAIIDAAGRETTFTYNADHLCTSFTTPNGHSASFAYDRGCNLTQVVDLIGEPVVYEYDQAGYLQSLVAARDKRTTTFGYGSGPHGQFITQITDASGHTTRYKLISDQPRQVRVIDPEGGATTYFSKDGYTEKVVDALGHAKVYGYAGGQRTRIQDKNGQITQLAYDEHGNLVCITGPLDHAVQFTYDAYSFLTSETNPLGETWQYEYDQNHNLLRGVSPLGVKSYQYDQRGLLVSVTDSNGHTTHYQYDRFGNLSAVTDAIGNTTLMSYDTFGLNLVSISDPHGNSTQFEYDANGRLARTTWPDGTARTYSYDCCAGNGLIDENGGETIFRRDNLLNITEYHYPEGNQQLRVLDRNGGLRRITDALGRTTSFDLDSLGQVTKITNPLSNSITMQYDPTGNLLVVNDENRQPISYQYDPRGALVSSTDALGKRVEYKRDALGRVSTVHNGRGSQINIAYNAAGQCSEVRYDAERYAAYKYDPDGNLLQVQDVLGTTEYQYTPLNQLNRIQYPGGLTVSYEHDAVGRVSTVNYPNGLCLTYLYDNRGRIINLSWDSGGVDYQYDGVSNLLNEQRANQTESSYQYNRNQLLTEIKHLKTGQIFASAVYQRDAAGNITEQQGLQPAHLPSSQKVTQASYNQLNQVENYSYDLDGNLTATSEDHWQAAYDSQNRLTEIMRQGQTSHFIYNGLGYRAQIINGQTQRNCHYDLAGNLLFESDHNGQVTALYVYHNGLLVARLDSGGDAHYYHYDHLGSTIALTNAQGEIAAAYAYDPFGCLVSRPAPEISQPFTYVGRFGVQDDGDSLFYMRNRHYNAHTGRFLQKDPIGIEGGINLYAYVWNNPVNLIDPDGLQGIQNLMIPPTDGGGVDPINFYDPHARAKEQIRQSLQSGSDAFSEVLIDRFFTYTPVINLPYSVLKTAYLAFSGRYKEAAWEGTKTAIGPFGQAAQVIEDLTALGVFDNQSKFKVDLHPMRKLQDKIHSYSPCPRKIQY